MAVTTTYSPQITAGDGATVSFSCPWPIFASTDIKLSVFDTSLSSLISPAPVLGGAGTYDYTVTLGSQDSVTLEYATATVVMNTALSSRYRVMRERQVAATQPNTYQENTRFPAASVGQTTDRAIMALQQTLAFASLMAIQVPPTDGSLSVLLPPAPLRLDKLLVCDPTTGQVTISTVSFTSIAAGALNASIAVAAAATATAQASLAAAQVTLAASQVALASGQVVLAASQVALASGQASIATAQATIATAQASLAQAAVGGVKASASDTTAAPLLSKLVAGTGITLTKNNPGGNETVTVAASASSGVVPQGRLTLTSGVTVMTADATAQGSVYYAPHNGNLLPIYDGSSFVASTFAQLTLTLDSNNAHTGYHQSTKLFDLFGFLNATVVTLGTGPAWTSSTARGSGAGTTELQQLSGLWTNKNAITLRFGSASGNTVSVAANQATYLGTMYATADGQTGMAFAPAATANGNNNILGLSNAYNRVTVAALCRDSTASWVYNIQTWRAINGSTSNRISFVDGLQQSPIRVVTMETVTATLGTNGTATGAALDSTSATPQTSAVNHSGGSAQTAVDRFAPQLGFHFVQGMEFGDTAGTNTFYGSGAAAGQTEALRVELEM